MSPRKKLLIVAAIVLTGGILLMLVSGGIFSGVGNKAFPFKYKNYVVSTIPSTSVSVPAPHLPNLSGYTLEGINKKMPALARGNVQIVPIDFILGMEKFTEKRRLVEFSRLQKAPDPLAIAINSGSYDLESLTKEINNPKFLEKRSDGIFLLKLPLYIENGASLTIRGTPKSPIKFRMSSVTGGFIVNSGKIFILNTHVAAWNDAEDKPSKFVSDHDFRPFFVSWSGSESYFYKSRFSDMGYSASKSYGISFSSAKSILKENPALPPPHGWLIDNIFERVYYGFYSYEAEDVVILHNVYRDCIIYGIDPHDRSKRLIIAKNIAYGTQKKHGIIVSREVNDGWIFDNVSFSNKGSGFMLDRSSVRNIVSGNVAFMNGGDGLTLFESQENIVYKNYFFGNKRSGFRSRNSWDIKAAGNWIIFNNGDGIQSYAFDIKKTEKDRDYIEDPFTEKSTLLMVRDIVIGNGKGCFKLNKILDITLSGIKSGCFGGGFMRGDLDAVGHYVEKGIKNKGMAIQISSNAPNGSDGGIKSVEGDMSGSEGKKSSKKKAKEKSSGDASYLLEDASSDIEE